MDNNNLTVNALWIGKYLSACELLTIKSFLNNGHRFVLWTYDEIKTMLPEGVELHDAAEIIPREKVFCYKYRNQFGHGKGSYAGFSDIFRYKLLYLYGGWWTDMDVTCLKPMDFEDEYVFRTHHSLPLVGNIMKCPKGSELMKACWEEAEQKIDENNRDWHLPINILVDNVNRFGLGNFIKSYSNPDSWNVVRKLLKGKTEVPDEWHVIHWINEEWRRNKIDRYYFLKKSFFSKLAERNGVAIGHPNFLKSISVRIKLSLAWHSYRVSVGNRN